MQELKVNDDADRSRIDLAETELNSLIEFHDFCFSVDKSERQRQMSEKIRSILVLLDSQDSVGDNAVRSRVAYIKGRSLDCLESYDPEAELHLSRSVKLNPSNVLAWNALGSCYWKGQNIESAISCLRESLVLSRSVDTLNLFNSILRQSKKVSYLSESLVLCRESLALDIRNSSSWFSLSLTLMSLYFSSTYQQKDLVRSIQALKQALSLPHRENDDTDMRSVLSQVYLYNQDYSLLTSGLDVDSRSIVSAYLTSLTSSVSSRGNLKSKVIDLILSDLVRERLKLNTNDSQVIVFGNVQQLVQSSPNDGNYCIQVKVIRHIGILSELPFTSFLCLEEGGRFVILTIYHYNYSSSSMNLVKSKAVLLINPIAKVLKLREIDSSLFDGGCSLDEVVILQVHHPTNIMVGGQPMDVGCFRAASLGLTAFDA